MIRPIGFSGRATFTRASRERTFPHIFRTTGSAILCANRIWAHPFAHAAHICAFAQKCADVRTADPLILPHATHSRTREVFPHIHMPSLLVRQCRLSIRVGHPPSPSAPSFDATSEGKVPLASVPDARQSGRNPSETWPLLPNGAMGTLAESCLRHMPHHGNIT